MQTHWSRAIILVDMNAFFASIEQHDFPELQQKPVVVTNGNKGTAIITASYEARAFGVQTGMRVTTAQKFCPSLISRPARHKRYLDISNKIMDALYQEITPDIEIYSIDEAFLDITHCQSLFGPPEKIAVKVHHLIRDVIHLPCSVGLSGDKTTAKYAAEVKKPNGITIIPPWEAKERLKPVPVTALCGIAEGVGKFLAKYGVTHCKDMENLPIEILKKRFGKIGQRLWFMCQGADPEPIHTERADPKTMGHGKVLPPKTKDLETILTYFFHMCFKLAYRLRRHQMKTHQFFIGIRTHLSGWCGHDMHTTVQTHDALEIFDLCRAFMTECWHGETVSHIQVTARHPTTHGIQFDLFEDREKNLKKESLYQTLDEINQRYGDYSVVPARLLNRNE